MALTVDVGSADAASSRRPLLDDGGLRLESGISSKYVSASAEISGW